MVTTAMSDISLTLSMFPSGAMSALFIATIIGLPYSLIFCASASMMSSSHLVGSSGGLTSLTAAFTSFSVTLSPARRS